MPRLSADEACNERFEQGQDETVRLRWTPNQWIGHARRRAGSWWVEHLGDHFNPAVHVGSRDP